MASVMEQHIPGELLPLAVEKDHLIANADEDLILAVLAAVFRQLEGTNPPIKTYLRRFECGDASKGHATPHERDYEEELKRSGRSAAASRQHECTNTPIKPYFCKYTYGEESENEEADYDYKQPRGLRKQELQ